jgi:hypothetical protein
MSKQPDNELARLDTGLALANDEDFAVPEEIKRELARYGVDDLWAAADRTAGLDRAVKIHTGFIFMALKERLKGNFKNAVIERYGRAAFSARFHRAPIKADAETCGRLGRTAYHGVWRCMSYARAALHLPEVVGRMGFDCIRKALSLPTAQLQEIQEKIIGIPAEIAKAITEEAIDAEYDEMRRRKRKRVAQRQATTNRPPAPTKNVGDDDLPTELDGLVNRALSALGLIADYKISPKEHARAERSMKEIEVAWNRASYNLGDPEHKKRPWWEENPMHDDISEP